MPGPDTPEEVAALAVLEESVALLVNLLGWGIALGMAIIWAHTFGPLFQGIARALTFTINTHFHYKKTFHLGGWASTLDHAATEAFTTWAKDQEQAVGMWWYAIGWTVNQMVVQAQELAATTARGLHWIVNVNMPGFVRGETNPIKKKTNQLAAAVGLAGIALHNLKHGQHAHEQAQAHTNATTKATVRDAERTAADTHSRVATVEHAAAHQNTVITEVIDIYHLPVPFGRTVSQIKKRLGLLEAGVGATAVAITMANVLGIPNWRCLTRGPIGRVARGLCGIPSNFLNDLLGLVADFFILENVCVLLPWIETAASEIGTPLVEVLTDVGAGLCHGSKAPAALQGPRASVPALIFGVSASEV